MDLIDLQSPLLIFLLSLCLCLCFYPTQKKPANKGFKIYPLVGTLPEFLKNRHQLLDWTTKVLSCCPTNTSTFSRPGTDEGLITANPLNIEHMLKTNFENYPKGHHFISILKDFLGQGIFNSDGELWKVQRKIASYEFSTKSISNFAIENVMVEIRTRLVPVLQRASETERVLDFQDILERFAFDNLCKLAFNVDPACLGDDRTVGHEFMRAFDDAATHTFERFMHAFPFIWKIKRFFNMGSEKRLKQSIAIVHEFADKIIKSRLEEKETKKDADLLSRFMQNHENSTEFLRDITISFILAGRDTTSSALTWFFWLLSTRHDIVQNILEEVQTVRLRGGKSIGDAYTLEELRDMHYLHAAISESLRFYPPVPIDSKTCQHQDLMPDGTVVKKGWHVIYNAYAMGRMKSIWGENCSEFLPERWLENGMYRPESAFRFPVFNGGPRICLGKDMAYIQMKSVAASVIERFELEVLTEKDKCPEHLVALTLRMKGGLPVRVKERCVDVID